MRSFLAPLCGLALLFSTATGSPAAEMKPLPRHAIGRVTFEGGKPITGDVQDYHISIEGVSEAGEKISYSPIVKNGAYKQRLVPGDYRFGRARIMVKFGETVYTLELVPVGPNWNKSQDAAEGIVQDFVWKPTGLRETYGAKPDPNNATHWHGLNLGMRFQTWRSDANKAATVLPAGTKLLFTLKPTSKSIDGRELQPITVEREWRPKDSITNHDLNDLPPANYELTGIAKLPDGTTRPILLQGQGVYPKFVTQGVVTVTYDNILGRMWKQPFGWVTD
ncbi:MAG: hypothetical protein JNK23_22260 [Opitutaceae bacterium]|nr:hypothetical protein [Opitutaceae bacterium]